MKLYFVILFLLKVSSSKCLNSSSRIVGGRDAEINEFPYIVSIRRTELELFLGFPYHVCGGSILNSNTVLTASHCLYDPFGNQLTMPGSYTVVAGLLHMYSIDNDSKIYFVSAIHPHPNFDTETLQNDIAIMKVQPDFLFNLPNIQPIIISSDQDLAESTQCSVHGWGVLFYDYPFLPDVLQTVDLRVSNFGNCNEVYEGLLTKKQLCAYELEKDSCSGDSGGPLVCNNLLVGIVSFGLECALPDIPGVYTKVAAFNDFIQKYETMSSATSLNKFGLIKMCIVLTFLMVPIKV